MKEFLIEDDLELAMKVIIVGNGCVGKSSLIQRFCRGIFTREYKKTIGVDFLERVLNVDENRNVRLMLWDTAGQEEFDAITRTYYRGANACILTCSITDRNSFNALPLWKDKVTRECGHHIPMVIVANKLDLQQKHPIIDNSALEEMARSLGITTVFRTSVKDDLNVETLFTHLAVEFIRNLYRIENDEHSSSQLIDEEHFLASLEYSSVMNDNDINKDDKPHHKFHIPVFGNFRTNPSNANDLLKYNYNHKNSKYNQNNKNGKIRNTKVKHQLVQNPFINAENSDKIGKSLINIRNSTPSQNGLFPVKDELKGLIPKTKRSGILYPTKNINSPKDFPYYFSTNGNHFTHWENNLPFRLDMISSNTNPRKHKKEICTIL